MSSGEQTAARPESWFAQLFSTFRGHDRSIYAILVSEILFGTAIGWFTVYRPVYMAALGVTEVQIGIISALLFCSQSVGAVLGGWAAGRFGSKRAMQFFDGFAWGAAIILWFFAQNFWYFAAAALVNGFFYGAIPNWNRIIADNTSSERRPTVYGLVHLCYLGSGLFGPVAGYFVSRYGLVTGNRVIYGAGFIIIGAAVLVRQLFIRTDKPRSTDLTSDNVVGAQLTFRQTISFIWKDYRVRVIMLTTVLSNYTLIIWNNYSSLYMTSPQGLGLSAGLISLFPLLSSMSIALVLLFIIPRIGAERYVRFLFLGSLSMALGLVLFLLIPKQVFWPLIIFALCFNGGNALLQPLRSSLQADIVASDLLPRVISVSSAFSLLASIPIGPLSGALYRLDPRFPFHLVIANQVLIALLFASLGRRGAAQ